MPTTSVLDAIFQTVLSSVNGLSLTLNGSAIPASVSKLPKREEAVDPAVQIAICLSTRGESTEPMAMGVGTANRPQMKVTYPVLITLIAPNNNDQVLNLQAYTTLRQSIRLLYRDRTPFVGLVSQVWDCDVKEAAFLDTKELADGYDYMVTALDVATIE